MGLASSIISKVRASGVETLVVIIDGKYLSYNGKNVYVRVTDSEISCVEFFVMLSDGSHESLPGMLEEIHRMLVSGTLFGVSASSELQVSSYHVMANAALGMMVLESYLYHAVREIAEKECSLEGRSLDYRSIWLRLSEDSFERPDVVKAFVQAFWTETRVRYQDLIYANGNNRFVNRLLKAYKFYAIERAFVPVFIDCSLFFNPMREHSISLTRMYADACAKGRRVSYRIGDGEVSGYFLTQEEICRAFGMHHFMRFTSSFWYKVYMGLLYPSMQAHFPMKGAKSWIEPQKNFACAYGLNPYYYTDEIAALLQETRNSEYVTLKGIRTLSAELREALNQYEPHDSLFAACKVTYSSLTSLGSTALDSKEASSIHSIYSYISEASLLLGG